MDEKILEDCRKHFATHKATLIQDTKRYFAIDWRRSDGGGDYYINYILDKMRGSLIISGDLGNCIATWYNELTAANVKRHLNSVDYFMEKFRCTSNDYTYFSDDVKADIREHFDYYGINVEEICEEETFDDVEEFWLYIENEVDESTARVNKFLPTDELLRMIEKIDGDYFEWLYDCGKRIHPRVYLWSVGFQMACEQLGL